MYQLQLHKKIKPLFKKYLRKQYLKDFQSLRTMKKQKTQLIVLLQMNNILMW